jgi:hypothetical protein
MPPRNEGTEKGKREGVRQIDEVGMHMSLKVMDRDQGDAEWKGHRLSKRYSDMKGAREARALREGDPIEFGKSDICIPESRIHNWHDIPLMSSGGKFRNDPSIGSMDGLAGDHMRADPFTLGQSGRGIIAG